jgi:hypothetical protein
MKKFLFFVFLIVPFCLNAQENPSSHWRGYVSYQNTFHNSYQLFSLGADYMPVEGIWLGVNGGTYFSDKFFQSGWGINTSVYPLQFFSKKNRRLKPYLKCSYQWIQYEIKEVEYETDDLELPIHGFDHGLGGFIGADFRLFKNVFLFAEVGLSKYNNYSAGIKINIDGWKD